MLKVFSIVAAALEAVSGGRRADQEETNGRQWRCDPLDYPALLRMSQTQLGDLPIGHPVLREPCNC